MLCSKTIYMEKLYQVLLNKSNFKNLWKKWANYKSLYKNTSHSIIAEYEVVESNIVKYIAQQEILIKTLQCRCIRWIVWIRWLDCPQGQQGMFVSDSQIWKTIQILVGLKCQEGIQFGERGGGYVWGVSLGMKQNRKL